MKWKGPTRWLPTPGSHIRVTNADYGDDLDMTFRVDRIEEKNTRVGPKVIVHAWEESSHPDDPSKRWGWRHRAFYLEDVEDASAPRKAKRASRATPHGSRGRGGPRPTEGRCEHCGEPTKGGRFVPGHDAKLKGDLLREQSAEADAERHIRGWMKDSASTEALKIAGQAGFLASRIRERIGE